MTNPITFYDRRNLAQIKAIPTKPRTSLRGAKRAATAAAAGGTNPKKLLAPLPTNGMINNIINKAKKNGHSKNEIRKIQRVLGTLVTPADQLNVMFDKITTHPITNTPLPSGIPFSVVDFLIASINLGYGPLKYISTNKIKWSFSQRSEILRYQIANAVRIATVLNFNQSNPTVAKPIYNLLEASDKASISFQIGSIATYLTAKEWIAASGDVMDMLVHESLYLVAYKVSPPKKTKHADFVAITQNQYVHVFESKGGEKNLSHEKIVKGLEQLEATKQFINHAISYVCVHASVMGGQSIDIVAYDPPGDNVPSDQSLDSIFDIGYLRIAQAMHAIDAFNVLTEAGKSEQNNTPWVFTTYPTNEKIRIAAPDYLLENGEELRKFLELDELAKDVNHEDKANPQKTNAIINELIKKLENTEYRGPVNWHLTTGRDRFNTIKELEDKLKANALEIIKNMDSRYNSHNFVSPFPEPTENDFILTTKGLICAKREFTAHFTQDGI